MKVQNLAWTTLAATSVLFTHSAIVSETQAAMLGNGSGTCEAVSFTYLDCAGAFSGNDKGAKGTGLDNLNEFFGEGWTLAGDSEDGTISFSSGGDGDKSGTAFTGLSGFGAVAVKAGKSYSLYTVEDLASFDWSTKGVNKVGNGKTPGLSHITAYTRPVYTETEKQEVPEPGMLLGLVAMVGAGARFKKSKGY